MLLSKTLRNLARSSVAHALLQQQLNRLTPISSAHRYFHRNEEILTQRRTGLANFSLGHYNLHKSIHTSSVVHFKYSNLLAEKQKVSEDVKREIKSTGKMNSDESKSEPTLEPLAEVEKLGLFARFKKMAKDYWYVLIPVHVVTSACWLGGFYYASKSGVDIIAMLEYYEFSETIIRPLRNSHLGHVAIAYFLYKIATPARYAVTLGGTTFAIRTLSKRGIIKPMPSRDQLVKIYKDKKDEMQIKVDQKKQDFQDKKQEFQDKFIKKD